MKLRYAQKVEIDWYIETVEQSGVCTYCGRYASLALDSDDNAHICTWDHLDTGAYRHLDLIYARQEESGWHMEVVDSEGAVGSFSSLALDNQQNPHIITVAIKHTNKKISYAYI